MSIADRAVRSAALRIVGEARDQVDAAGADDPKRRHRRAWLGACDLLERLVLEGQRRPMLTVAEAAERAGVAKSTVGAWIDAGELPAADVAARGHGRTRLLRIAESDLERFLEARATRAARPRRVGDRLAARPSWR